MSANPRSRGVIKRAQVQLDGAPVRRASAPPPQANGADVAAALPAARAHAAHAPRARLLQLDEHTQAIELTCACGEVSLIEIERPKP
jgi:hypothetical protein